MQEGCIGKGRTDERRCIERACAMPLRVPSCGHLRALAEQMEERLHTQRLERIALWRLQGPTVNRRAQRGTKSRG